MTDRPNRSRGSQHDDWLRDAPSALARAFAPVAGYGVTISSMFRPVVTEQYPFEPPQVMPRYHGRHQLNRYDDGLEKCIGCELCAWACPADAIYVEAASNEPGAQYSPGERYGRVYQINYLRCIFCGMCIPMVEGTEDGDYYRGRVTGSTQAQIDWVRAQRPDDPSLAGARAKATPTASGWGAKQTVKGAVR